MEATSRNGFWFDAECRLVEPAAIIVACSTCAHRRLCATIPGVPVGYAEDDEEPRLTRGMTKDGFEAELSKDLERRTDQAASLFLAMK
jgi:hypothetical protein